jgi:hypothetical protein
MHKRRSINSFKVIRAGLLAIALIFILTACRQKHEGIRQAIGQQLELYPESTLQDIYKSFFQDEFGPGHLLDDTAGARKYLEYELANMISRGNYRVEPCGAGTNFCRVPLDLVKDGRISFEEYFSAFMSSASSFKTPEVKDWSGKWEMIVEEIEKMDVSIEGFEEDKDALEQMLLSGEVVVHHSPVYVERYDPHYRIMARAIRFPRLEPGETGGKSHKGL